MHSIFYFLLCGVLVATSATENTNTKVCPLLGPAYPVPTGLSSNEQFQAATKLIDAALNTTLETGTTVNGPGPYNATTMSIGMFSISEEDLIYQYHYTDPSVRNSKVGLQEVDEDSIYRLGSISKLLTIYLFLIREGDQRFNDPITKYIPELATAAASTSDSLNGITPNWNEITIGQLASHMSGIAIDYGALASCMVQRMLIMADGSSDASYPWINLPGSPPIPENQIPTCNFIEADGTFKTCSREEYLAGLATEPALFLSGSTPVYSNNAFELLGIALENITGCDLEKLFTESIVDALGLYRTSFTVPNSTQHGVIPGDIISSGWGADVGVLAPSGGYFSSTNDVATIGKAILNSTLLSKAQTRRWIKPFTFTSDLNVGIGAPWEIYRAQVGGRTVDLYTKNGGAEYYATILVLVPDFDFGFSILSASEAGESVTARLVYFIAEIVSSTILPVLEKVAKDKAEANFAGHYSASNLNSSFTIITDDQSGLRVTDWVSNGTEFLANIGTHVDFRIQPNQLYSGNKAGFTGLFQELPAPIYSGPFDLNCLGWAGVDRLAYGNVGLDQVVFEIDPTTGKAISVQPRALRITLEKKT